MLNEIINYKFPELFRKSTAIISKIIRKKYPET